MSDAEAVFSGIYHTDHWRGGSGEGSTAVASAPYRGLVGELLRARDVRSVVDVGCGDWQVGRLVDWSGVSYTGVDVVPEIVARHTREHGRPGLRFEVGDARSCELPRADLLLVKDVLQHWPTEDVAAFLARQAPRYRYLVATNDVGSVHWSGGQNADTPLGGWRTLDLGQPPFAVRAALTWDYEVAGGTWTKQVTMLSARRPSRLPGSALARARSWASRDGRAGA